MNAFVKKVLVALFALGFVQMGQAQTDIYKADNGTKLSDTNSWVGGVVPGSEDLVWFSDNTKSRSANTGVKNHDWKGIVVTNSLFNWTINSGSTDREIKLGSEGFTLAEGNGGDFASVGFKLGTNLTINIVDAERELTLNEGTSKQSCFWDAGDAYSVTKAGEGMLTLNGTSSNWNGNLIVNEGTVQAAVANALGNGSVLLNDGARLIAANKTQPNPVVVSGDVHIDKNIVLTGDISGDASSSITHEPVGGNANFKLQLRGDNSGFLGIITNNAIVSTDNKNGFGSGSLVLNDGSSIGVAGASSPLIDSDAIQNDIELNGTVLLGATSTGNDFELAGDISGSGGLAMAVLGHFHVEVTLSGNNTYAGPTDVTDGFLIVNGDNSGALGTITVTNGAALGGSGTVGGDVVFDADAKFLFSSNSTLTANGALVDLGTLGVADMAGLDGSVEPGFYALMDGSASFDFSDVQNIGADNAYYLGSGKEAYLVNNGGLELVVVAASTDLPVSIEFLPGNTNLVISWPSETVDSYGIETTTDLISVPWELVVSNYPGTGGDLSFTGTVTDVQRFYNIFIEE